MEEFAREPVSEAINEEFEMLREGNNDYNDITDLTNQIRTTLNRPNFSFDKIISQSNPEIADGIVKFYNFIGNFFTG